MQALYSSFHPWEEPEITSMARLPMSSLAAPYDTCEEAYVQAVRGPEDEELTSPWYLSLDGPWHFKLYDNPLSISQEAVLGDSLLQESCITVPGSWTIQGYDKPHYTNVQMPFAAQPPHTPRENPTGVYGRHFTVPHAWENRRTVLRVGSAESFLSVYLNGQFIGGSKDSRLSADFDLSSYLKSGENMLVLVVVRYSDSSYIEDQDQWWFGGLHRSVALYSTPHTFLQDVFIHPVLTSDFMMGTLSVDMTLGQGGDGGMGIVPPQTARVYLYDGQGNRVGGQSKDVDCLYRTGSWKASVAMDIDRPHLWSHEKPYLYTVVVSLTEVSSGLSSCYGVQVGFRHAAIKDRMLLINGKRVFIKGVNRHEHDDCTAKTLDIG